MNLFVTLFSTLVLMVGCATKSPKTESSQTPKTVITVKQIGNTTTDNGTKTDAKADATTTCSKGNDVRTLKIEMGTPNGCKALYTVQGQEKAIATAQNESGYCQPKIDKLKQTLTSAGYACN